MMKYKDKFSELYTFFAGYFNQDWMHIYEFGDEKPSVLEVARFYKTEDSAEGIGETAEQLKELMEMRHNEEQLRDILHYDLGSDYYAPGDNWTYREWLEKTLEILKNPNEKTKITGRANDGYDPPSEEMLAILRE